MLQVCYRGLMLLVHEFISFWCKARVITAWLGDETSNLALANPQDDELSLMAQCMLLGRSSKKKTKYLEASNRLVYADLRHNLAVLLNVVEQTPRYVGDDSAIQMQYRAESRAAVCRRKTWCY